MKKMFFAFIMCLVFLNLSFAQKRNNKGVVQIKQTIISFLSWYKINENKLYDSSIITGFNTDTVKKGLVVNINMKAVEKYLSNFKRSNYVSEVFLNGLRQTYQSVADTLVKYPLVDYFGPIGGLEADLIFGFEPEDILDHIKEGHFTKIRIVYDKAIVKFDVTKINQYIFTLTKVDRNWLIDYFGLDRTNIDRIIK